jgi:hypothetical protein
MGVHLLVRKAGMSRLDVEQLLSRASYLDPSCFVKEAHLNTALSKLGLGADLPLLKSPASIKELPDEWLDLGGVVVFNPMEVARRDEIREALGVPLPEYSSSTLECKSTKGGRLNRIALRKSLSEDDRAREWLLPRILTEALREALIRGTTEQSSWIYETFNAIADGNFEVALLL